MRIRLGRYIYIVFQAQEIHVPARVKCVKSSQCFQACVGGTVWWGGWVRDKRLGRSVAGAFEWLLKIRVKCVPQAIVFNLGYLLSSPGGAVGNPAAQPQPRLLLRTLEGLSEELCGHTVQFQAWLLGKWSRIKASQDTEPTLEMKILKDSFYLIGFWTQQRTQNERSKLTRRSFTRPRPASSRKESHGKHPEVKARAAADGVASTGLCSWKMGSIGPEAYSWDPSGYQRLYAQQRDCSISCFVGTIWDLLCKKGFGL